MNIIELRDRLNAIIAENEQNGRTDRNRLPVVVRVARKRDSPDRRFAEFQAFPVRNVSSTQCGYGGVVSPSALPEFEHVMEIGAGQSIIPERTADMAHCQRAKS